MTREHMSKAKAADELHVTVGTLNKLVVMGRLPADGGKPTSAGVSRLVAMRENRVYEPGPGPDELIIACPVASTELGANMDLRQDPVYLPGHEGPLLADLPPGQVLTGCWDISAERASQLVPGGILLAVTGKYAFEAWRVVEEGGRVEHIGKKRAVFVVERLPERAEARYLGFVPHMSQACPSVH